MQSVQIFCYADNPVYWTVEESPGQVADVLVLKLAHDLCLVREVQLEPYFETYDGFPELTASTNFPTTALIACVVLFTTSIAERHTKDAFAAGILLLKILDGTAQPSISRCIAIGTHRFAVHELSTDKRTATYINIKYRKV